MKIPRVVNDSAGSALAIVRERDLLLLEDCVLLTQSEVKYFRGLLQDWIDDQGSIFNDPARVDEENDLRSKFKLVEMKSAKSRSETPVSVG